MDTLLREPPNTALLENEPHTNQETSLSLMRALLMDRVVELLIEKAKSHLFWPDLYAHAEQVLKALSQTSHEYRIARRHLRNARTYANYLEFGAAAFELRMLRSAVADCGSLGGF